MESQLHFCVKGLWYLWTIDFAQYLLDLYQDIWASAALLLLILYFTLVKLHPIVTHSFVAYISITCFLPNGKSILCMLLSLLERIGMLYICVPTSKNKTCSFVFILGTMIEYHRASECGA